MTSSLTSTERKNMVVAFCIISCADKNRSLLMDVVSFSVFNAVVVLSSTSKLSHAMHVKKVSALIQLLQIIILEFLFKNAFSI